MSDKTVATAIMALAAANDMLPTFENLPKVGHKSHWHLYEGDCPQQSDKYLGKMIALSQKKADKKKYKHH